MRNCTQVSTNNFNRCFPPNACMLSQIDITHTTTFDEPYQSVPTESFPRQHIHCDCPSYFRKSIAARGPPLAKFGQLFFLNYSIQRGRKRFGIDGKNVLHVVSEYHKGHPPLVIFILYCPNCRSAFWASGASSGRVSIIW